MQANPAIVALSVDCLSGLHWPTYREISNLSGDTTDHFFYMSWSVLKASFSTGLRGGAWFHAMGRDTATDLLLQLASDFKANVS